MILTDDQVSGLTLDHLGLVASTIDKLGIMDKIDAKLPISKQHGSKVSMGKRVGAMILNGLGFIDDRLYMFPLFMANKPVERLLGENLAPACFNDDALGRCLDAISDYGVTKLFTELSFDIGVEQGLLGFACHFDTSTLSLYGTYEQEDSIEVKGPAPAHGHSKARRPDLKQMVINLATTGKAGFPIWMEAHNGNASDQVVLHEAAQRMETFCSGLAGSQPFLYVGDSAMYSHCVKYGDNLRWLSRVPERVGACKDLVQMSAETFTWHEMDSNYRHCEIGCNYGGVEQRWLMVFSEHAYKREIKTLEKNIKKEYEQATKMLRHFNAEVFSCSHDAEVAAAERVKKLKYHHVEFDITPVTKHAGSGRPKKDVTPDVVGYIAKGCLSADESKITPIRNQKGRFVLGSNEFDIEKLSSTGILIEYKEQSKTESGFKFIKDDTFEVDSIFLKKPARIEALMMVMTLCLMVYGVAQYFLRESLKKSNETVPDQMGKPIQNPTMKWVYRLFQGVQVLSIHIEGVCQTLVINLNALLKRIIGYFGTRALGIYGLPSG